MHMHTFTHTKQRYVLIVFEQLSSQDLAEIYSRRRTCKEFLIINTVDIRDHRVFENVAKKILCHVFNTVIARFQRLFGE